MARAIDMGDVSDEASHSAEYTLSALLPAAELKDKVSGKDFITAFVVGQEVLIRIGWALDIVAAAAIYSNEGGHFIFGPTAAVAKLLGLSFEQLQDAMGIANAMTQHWEMNMYAEAALSVRAHHGFVAQDAVNACMLAKRGITGPHSFLLGDKGFLGLHTKWTTYPDRIWDGLGKVWHMRTTMLKPYAACKCTHTALDGIIDLMRENKFEGKDIDKIHIDESPVNVRVVVEPREAKWNPHTIPECQFSLPYTVATAAFDNKVFLEQYTEKARERKDVRDLMPKITVEEDKSLAPLAARVNVTLKDGRKFSKEAVYVKGHIKNPFTDEELLTKFRWMLPYSAYKLSDKVVDLLIDKVLNLEKSENVVADVIVPLMPK
jgi:2-methylcitrate dehydratase PrpD